MRYTLSIHQDLIEEVRKAAADEGAKRGKPMPTSEWIRRAVYAELKRLKEVGP